LGVVLDVWFVRAAGMDVRVGSRHAISKDGLARWRCGLGRGSSVCSRGYGVRRGEILRFAQDDRELAQDDGGTRSG